MTKKKILLIEDNPGHYLKIKNELTARFGDAFELFPFSPVGRRVEDVDFSPNERFIGKLVREEFRETIDLYPAIDLYIVDVHLIKTTDIAGLEFCRFLLENHIDTSYRVIITSSTDQKGNIFDDRRVTLFRKYDKGRHFARDLAKVVEKTINIGHLPVPQTPGYIAENSGTDQAPYDRSYKLHEQWESIREWMNRATDGMIFIAFNILLAATTGYALVSILYSIAKPAIHWIKSWWINVNPALAAVQNGEAIINNSDTTILTTAEHIFLYLLPIFIVSGFFEYYKSSPRISFLGGGPNYEADENSTRTMNLTKILFISSIIAYVLIKIIEEIFFPMSGKEISYSKVALAGSLLIVLMFYFAFLDRKNH